MTKRQDAPADASAAPTPEEIAEIAEQAEVLFKHPDMVPGRSARNLSPREMIEVTHEPRMDQTQDPGLWLTETPLNAIDKDGIDLLRRTFTGLDLLPLTTGRKGRLRRDLVMRYNRAELARGVLEEIVVLQRDPQGVYTELGRARRTDVFQQDTDYSVVLRERAAYINDLIEKVNLDKEAFTRIESGTEALEELVSAIQARQRFQRRARPKAIVAKPRWQDRGESRPETDADYEAMAANRPEAADPVVPAELRIADIIAGSDETEKPKKTTGRKSKRSKKSGTARNSKRDSQPSEGGKKSSSDASAAEEGADVPLPLAGGSAGLADLLSSAPLDDEDDT